MKFHRKDLDNGYVDWTGTWPKAPPRHTPVEYLRIRVCHHTRLMLWGRP